MKITSSDIDKAFDEFDLYDDVFEHLLKTNRWPDGVVCPRCSCRTIYSIEKGKRYKCRECSLKFSNHTGTVFENTKLPLCTWFCIINQLLKGYPINSNCGEMRELWVTQKASYYLLKKVKPLIKDGYFQLTTTV